MLSLVVENSISGEQLIRAQLAWSEKTCEKIIPKRKADEEYDGEVYWNISVDRRAAFCRHVNRVIDEHGTKEESLFGFFVIVGTAEEFLKNRRVKWRLLLNDEPVVRDDGTDKSEKSDVRVGDDDVDDHVFDDEELLEDKDGVNG